VRQKSVKRNSRQSECKCACLTALQTVCCKSEKGVRIAVSSCVEAYVHEVRDGCTNRSKKGDNTVLLQEVLMNEEQVKADIRSLVCMYRDTSFTGRAVARIFHGIASPCFPAHVWGRCCFWRVHLKSNFNLICKVAAKEILQLR